MTPPQLSVLVTVYNGEQHLSKTIDSILGQTFGDFELLIIDDGSQDATWEILRRYSVQDSRVNLMRNVSNIGITRSMNKLFALAQGELITRHDADDISRPDRFIRQVRFLLEHPAIGLISSSVDMVDSVGETIDLKYFTDETDNGTLQQQLLIGNCFCQGSVMFRTSCLEAIGYYDENLDSAEDYDLWLRMAEVTDLARLPQKLYQYRVHSASISNTKHGLQLQNMAVTLEKTVRRRSALHNSEELFLRIAGWYLDAARWYYESGVLPIARQNLVSALRLWPAAFNTDEPKAGLLPTEAGLNLVGAVFAEVSLPVRWWYLKRRFVSALFMQEVFAGVKNGDLDRVDANLWSGLRHNPFWLFNRGVLSLFVQMGIGRLKRLRST